MNRAGRPGFDTSGVAVIMTSTEDKHLYEGMSLCAEVVESSLLPKIVEGLSELLVICYKYTQHKTDNSLGTRYVIH